MAESEKHDSIENKNLDYNMTSKSRIRNTKYLNTLGRNARGEAEAKVKEVIKLYSSSKVPQLSTAENMIIDLIYNMKIQDSKKPHQKNMKSLLQNIKRTNR